MSKRQMLQRKREQAIDEAVRRVVGPKVIRLIRGYVRENGLSDNATLMTEDDSQIPLICAEFRRIEVQQT